MKFLNLEIKTKAIISKIIYYNPLITLSLGICSSLAVTNQVRSSLFMSLGVFFTLVCSSVIVSYLRNKIPKKFRLITFMTIISTFVIFFEKIIKVLYPSVAYNLGAYVGLIITNCIILGNIETTAIRNNPKVCFYNSFMISTSFGFLLLFVSVVREALGNGSILGMKIFNGDYEPILLFSSPAGAFLVLAVLIYASNCISNKLSVN